MASSNNVFCDVFDRSLLFMIYCIAYILLIPILFLYGFYRVSKDYWKIVYEELV